MNKEKTEQIKTFYTSNREEWRQWLADNFQKEKEIWFVFPMKSSGEERLSYNDAVEEALCFGWIDSTIRNIDSTHRAQHFTPRKQGSGYSQPNIERLIWLDKRGMINESLRESILPIIQTPYEFPADIIAVIKSDEKAWSNYLTLPEPYKRIRIAYIASARHRPEEYKKRLSNFIAKTRENKMITGYGGIEKYYE